ncbi:MAG: DUF2244 domain-containing protein [Thiomonas arsenitoxydans]|jgi:uncharacterized membrane protein|uniref:DUF2244 domain-containing protein n=1 Tax=Thiomonas arsenitoxydans (strain DSM 22701 / CIP 110005 / 3As) TaxID=426114 RepID=A0A8I1MXX4_THIA3|nr:MULTISPECIES: DUF2244 domain-containing protein [Thiomonas]MBN8745030.1 DUF2244 domain-containing protein [Thiomonas arsenitoxydans]
MHHADLPQSASNLPPQDVPAAEAEVALEQSSGQAPDREAGEGWMRDWVFRRNCSMSPRQLIVFYASLCVVSLIVASIAWDVGGSLVLPFTGIELGSVALALVVYGRHATDRERVRLSTQQLQVEWENAGVVQSVSFNPHWVRVSLPESGLVEVSSAGRTVYIGRYSRPERRAVLAKDLRAALRAL